MRIAMSVGHGTGLEGTAQRLDALESAGLDIAWVGEGYGFDAPTLLGFLAARTTRLELGAGILNVFSRPPTLIAATAATLDYVSGGRALIGIGSSGPQAIEGWYGVPYNQPIRRTRETIEICRQVWRRERVEHRGAYRIPLPPDQGSGLGKPLKSPPIRCVTVSQSG
jgi:alkanesulfonate monooxygenase SsuD/methylene tetrahydromethanopterin reductase-like flavin-dependent oxidoreductase (luciferase family)